MLEGFPMLDIYGKPASGIGHRGHCPQCKRDFVIVAGADNLTFMGKNIAVEGMQTSCGAFLIATQHQATVDSTPGENIVLTGSYNQLVSVTNTVSAFDERIRFFTANRNILADTPYKLFLDDGSVVEGRTDSGGKTERICTDQETAITGAEFYPETIFMCGCQADNLCGTGGQAPSPALKVDIAGIKTNSTAVGNSTVNYTLPAATTSRGMTPGEVAMARTVFKDAIDYSKVKIHRGGLFGQPNRTGNAMTPRGEIYFPADDYRDDFSAGVVSDSYRIWFVHELSHVWQYQLGYSVVWAGFRLGAGGGYSKDGAINRPSPAYRYNLAGSDKGKELPDFNMEQQAELISHYFAATQLGSPRYFAEQTELAKALGSFITNPKDATLLPSTTLVEPAP